MRRNDLVRQCGMACAVVLTVPSCGCRPFPVGPGETITYSRCGAPAPICDSVKDCLQIRWLGTACHSIKLGDVSVLTDPYFSHYNIFRVGLGKIPSNPHSVCFWTHELQRPEAIFIGHAHYDHLLDLAETRRQRGWNHVPIIGGPTVGHVVAGYKEGIKVEPPKANGEWQRVEGTEAISFQAFRAQHAPHLGCLLFYPGALDEPRETPPIRARHFPLGETYTYLIKLEKQGKEFTVFFAGAATDGDVGVPEQVDHPVDVAILCVPSWMNVRGYPEKVIERLQPRVIIMSHLDNFLQDGWEKRRLIATAGMKGWLKKALRACDYPHFERIVLTDVGGMVVVAPR